MTDDLVRRLRDWQPKIAVGYHSPAAANTIGEAADRIEALETALREKDNIAYVIDSHGISHDTFTIVYRAALAGEKKDG
ncbi:hypothetical protein UFOVP155_5 [uncultured Caudovirales phage]|uniref:Uncharacterized protein n=1 Tax=uncultured Caudovirales phage TaxID=2100421 RepID=A0A6J7WBP3_9CAUD|nr:hypothetical protein UFOVP155_5 [uncultured Caudovirales phage]